MRNKPYSLTHTQKSATPVAGLRPSVLCAYVQLLLLLVHASNKRLHAATGMSACGGGGDIGSDGGGDGGGAMAAATAALL